MTQAVTISPAGAIVAVALAVAVASTLWWMLHPPSSFVQRLAAQAEDQLERLIGSIIVVFSADINSGHMMALAARLARGERSDVHAIYVIEVPFTLPPDAGMPAEERAALDALGAAEAIAMRTGANIRTDIVKAREISQAVLDLAKRERANLIMMGSYLEGKYTGAPLGRDIEQIAADAKCDVLIGVEGKHGTVLTGEAAQASGTADVSKNTSL
ncbi:MAG TPA: universal stress protein [Candidatus Baltobacteraceae bacterium]|jgi:nucleotide-binding universal stress UspA family protein|nr:universal stress protein [Candidatus Baltobacteraceae bacterium]